MSIRILSWGCLLFFAALAPLALAEALYKSTMPDGKIIYGDKPISGAVKVEKYTPDTSKQGIAPPVSKKMEKDRAKSEAGGSKVEAAEKALRDAEAARAAGKDPREGDRQGTVSGNQRLTDAYWERQKSLEQAVEQARRSLDQARSGK